MDNSFKFPFDKFKKIDKINHKKGRDSPRFKEFFTYFEGLEKKFMSASKLDQNSNRIEKKMVKINTLCTIFEIPEKNKSFNEKFKSLYRTIETIKASQVFSFFYKDLHGEYYYWELGVFLRKFLLCFFIYLSELFPEEINNLIIVLLLFVALCVTFVNKPYIVRIANSLEVASLSICIFTYLLNIFENSNSHENFVVAMEIMFFVMNVFFILFCAMFIFKELRPKLLKNYKKFLQKIQKNY